MPDEKKHQIIQQPDEQISGETSNLGSMPEESQDVDELVESVGLKSDKNGPHELNSLTDLEVNKKKQ